MVLMITEVNLPQDRFLNSKLVKLKKKTIIFGKNGTGKSSITEAIQNQYSSNQDVRIFQGFEKIIKDNGGLNAITLGKENAELQPQIEEKEAHISSVEKEIVEPNDGEENLFSKLRAAKKRKSDKEREISNFLTQSASKIKNSHTELTGPNFNKNSLLNLIPQGRTLTDEQIEQIEKTINQHTITIGDTPIIYNPDIKSFIKATDEVVKRELIESVLLNFKSTQQKNWVKQGLEFHEQGEKCAFCGGIISESRLNDLNSYFNDEVKSFENDLKIRLDNIKVEKSKVQNIAEFDKNHFYPKCHNQVNQLNSSLSSKKLTIIECFDRLVAVLEKRNKDLFVSLSPVELDIPTDFSDEIVLANRLFEENKLYGEQLEKTKKDEQNKLLLHLVAKALKEGNYDVMKAEERMLNSEVERVQKQFDGKSKELKELKDQLSELLQQTVDESLAAENINKLLGNLGNQSFSLVKIDSDNQKGQYQIKDHKGNIRDILTLSTGEKNIVAFLWFMYDLDNASKGQEDDTIVVFDDPMNSNDDTVQYLIISKLQDLLKNIGNRQVFILTHSAHFYLNLRYRWWNNNGKQAGDRATLHLKKTGVKSKAIHIYDAKDDLCTSYDALWKEVRWLYDEGHPDYMLNPLRRIFETYQKFNGIKDLYKDNAEAQKLFNVNSHSIDDLEADLNGKNEEAIMKIVESIFKEIDGLDHFRHYWGGDD